MTHPSSLQGFRHSYRAFSAVKMMQTRCPLVRDVVSVILLDAYLLHKTFDEALPPVLQVLYEALEAGGSPAKQSLIGEYGGSAINLLLGLCVSFLTAKVSF